MFISQIATKYSPCNADRFITLYIDLSHYIYGIALFYKITAAPRQKAAAPPFIISYPKSNKSCAEFNQSEDFIGELFEKFHGAGELALFFIVAAVHLDKYRARKALVPEVFEDVRKVRHAFAREAGAAVL